MSLKTDYKNDVLDTSVNTKRIFNLVDQDGNIVAANVSIQDVTKYTQTGDSFGAPDINATNEAVNNKFDSGDVVNPMETTEPGFAADAYKTRLQFDEQNKNLQGVKFNVDETGRIISYTTEAGGADSEFPFSSLDNLSVVQANYKNTTSESSTNTCTQTITANKDYKTCLVFVSGSVGNNAQLLASVTSLTLTSDGDAKITLLEDSGNLTAANAYRRGASRAQIYRVTNLKSSEVLTATMINGSAYGAYFVTMQILN